MQKERNFDFNQLIGFVLIAILFGVYFWMTKPSEEELARQKQELLAKEATEKNKGTQKDIAQFPTDSLATQQVVKEENVTFENEHVKIQVNGRGGQIGLVQLKEHLAFDSLKGVDAQPLLSLIHI